MSGLSAAPVDVLAEVAAAVDRTVGTYVFASTSQGNFSIGTLRAGSGIRPCGFAVGGAGNFSTTSWNAPLTGTWRAMGRAPGLVGTWEGVTLWKREV